MGQPCAFGTKIALERRAFVSLFCKSFFADERNETACQVKTRDLCILGAPKKNKPVGMNCATLKV